MKKSGLTKLLIFFILAAYYLLLTTSIFAQSLSLSISPPLLEIVIKPGKSTLIAYSIQNFGDPVVLTPRVVSFEPSDDLGNIKLKEEIEGPVRFNLDNSEIKLGKPFFLKPKTKEQLLLRIRVPENAPEGDFYYSLILTTNPNLQQNQNTAAAAQATIAANILITITETGKIDIKPKIVYFDIIPRLKLFKKLKIVDSFDKIPVVLKVENTGKNYVKAAGKIELQGIFGAKASWKLIPKNILSSSQRLLVASNEAGIKIWKHKKKPVSFILPASFYFGKYTLRASVNFGEESPTVLTANTTFIALPLKLLLILVGGIGGYLIINKKLKAQS